MPAKLKLVFLIKVAKSQLFDKISYFLFFLTQLVYLKRQINVKCFVYWQLLLIWCAKLLLKKQISCSFNSGRVVELKLQKLDCSIRIKKQNC